MIELTMTTGRYEGSVNVYQDTHKLIDFLDKEFGTCDVQGWKSNNQGQIIRPANQLILATFRLTKIQIT